MSLISTERMKTLAPLWEETEKSENIWLDKMIENLRENNL